MKTKMIQGLLLGGVTALSLGLAGCADDGQDDLFLVVHPPHGPGPECVIDGAAICEIPALGPALIESTGGSCPDDPGELTPAALCPVPGLGPALVEIACGFTCPGGAASSGSDSGGSGLQCLPDQCDPDGSGCLSDIPGFEELICP